MPGQSLPILFHPSCNFWPPLLPENCLLSVPAKMSPSPLIWQYASPARCPWSCWRIVYLEAVCPCWRGRGLETPSLPTRQTPETNQWSIRLRKGLTNFWTEMFKVLQVYIVCQSIRRKCVKELIFFLAIPVVSKASYTGGAGHWVILPIKGNSTLRQKCFKRDGKRWEFIKENKQAWRWKDGRHAGSSRV